MKVTNDYKIIADLFDLKGNAGFSERDLNECENRLEIKIPRKLKDYYQIFGKEHKLNYEFNKLVIPTNLEFDEENCLIIYIENQGVAAWGIKKENLNLENPPVHIKIDNENWILESDFLTGFLVSMAHLQAVFTFPYNANTTCINAEVESQIRNHWKNLELKVKHGNAEFFQNGFDEIICILQGSEQVDLFIATKSEISFREIDLKLNLEWDYSSLDEL